MLKSLHEIFAKRGLLVQMVASKLVTSQKELSLGYAWWVLEPLLLTFVYWLLVSVIFHRGGENFPLFVLCGLVPYRAFALSFSQSVSSLSSQFSLMSLLNFPRIFLPISLVLVNHIKLLFGFVVIICFALLCGVSLSYWILLLFIPYLLQIFILFGIAMFCSILGVYIRDLKNLMQFVMRVLLYVSPVLYSIDRIPDKYQDIFLLNPIASLILMYRDVIMYANPPDLKMVCIVTIEVVLFVSVGFVFFLKNERNILKYL